MRAPGWPQPGGFAVLDSEARRRPDPDNRPPFPALEKNLDTMGSRGCNEGLRRKNCKIVKKAVPDLCPVSKTPAMTPWPGQNQWLCNILGFFHGDGTGFADLDAAFASQAFFGIDRNRLAVLDFKYFHRAYIHALFTTFAFFCVNGHIKSHFQISFLIVSNYDDISWDFWFRRLRCKIFLIIPNKLSSQGP
jgi:hypothetical protein